MKSAVRFFFFKNGIDVNKEIDAYLQKVPAWEVVSVSHQIFPTGISVTIAFRNTSQAKNNAAPEMTVFAIG